MNILQIDRADDNVYRPRSFEDFVGNKELVQKVHIAIEGALARKDSVCHILLGGPPGTGKTSIAQIVASSCNAEPKTVTATAIQGLADIMDIVMKMPENGVLFIDEIHALSKKIEEQLYTVLEDFCIDIKKDRGLSKSLMKMKLPKFCVIGATTKMGVLSEPFRDRFGLIHTMEYYTPAELTEILSRNVAKLKISIDNQEALVDIAKRSRGVPRVALRLLGRARDFASAKNNGVISRNVVSATMELERIDENGLTRLDLEYLQILSEMFSGKPAGINAIAASMNTDKRTVDDVIEPFLLREGYVVRANRGRVLTDKGFELLVSTMKQNGAPK